MPDSVTVARTCAKCGESFMPRRMGRPRKFCPHCTPRSDEDKAAAAEHWAQVRVERARERNAAAREQLEWLTARRERLYADQQQAG